jgi:hypothetical protein
MPSATLSTKLRPSREQSVKKKKPLSAAGKAAKRAAFIAEVNRSYTPEVCAETLRINAQFATIGRS